MNTKYNKQAHGSLKDALKSNTNYKDVSPQVHSFSIVYLCLLYIIWLLTDILFIFGRS